MRKKNIEKELSGFLVGGQTVLGKPSVMTQIIDESDPKRRAYHPSRDILHAFPELMVRVLTACKLKAIPAIEDRFKGNKEFERKVLWGFESLSKMVAATRDTGYEDAMKSWLEIVDDDVAEFIVSLFGRAILEFYFCCLMQVKSLNINGAEATKAAAERIRNEVLRYKECRRTEGKASSGLLSSFFQRCAASWRKLRERWATKPT